MGNMLTRKEIDYFEMFAKGITISLDAAKRLQSSFSDGKINETELKFIKEAEHEGDKHVHECLAIIDSAFITPIDRTDIIEILKAIENVTDSIDEVANHLYMMRITEADEYMAKFVDLTVASCEILYELMACIKQYKKNPKKIKDLIIEVNHLEEEGDDTYTKSMRNLFECVCDPIIIIKSKEMYQILEHTLDCCEDVADMVRKIMISNT